MKGDWQVVAAVVDPTMMTPVPSLRNANSFSISYSQKKYFYSNKGLRLPPKHKNPLLYYSTYTSKKWTNSATRWSCKYAMMVFHEKNFACARIRSHDPQTCLFLSWFASLLLIMLPLLVASTQGDLVEVRKSTAIVACNQSLWLCNGFTHSPQLPELPSD